jgi:hypothetical protein
VVGDPDTIEFVIAERWESSLAEYRIEGASTLTAQDGVQLITTPAQADFLGTPEKIPTVERQEQLLDVFNPQDVPNQLNGGLVVGTSGDYELEAGETFLKKLIWREIFSEQGEFVHLADTTWGLGVKPKELLRDTDIVSLQRRLKNSINRQPEVVEASVQVEVFADGRASIRIRAQTDFGPLDVATPLDLTSPVGGFGV